MSQAVLYVQPGSFFYGPMCIVHGIKQHCFNPQSTYEYFDNDSTMVRL